MVMSTGVDQAQRARSGAKSTHLDCDVEQVVGCTVHGRERAEVAHEDGDLDPEQDVGHVGLELLCQLAAEGPLVKVGRAVGAARDGRLHFHDDNGEDFAAGYQWREAWGGR